MFLQSHDKFDEVAFYDHETGSISVVSKTSDLRNSPPAVNGFFAVVGGQHCLFYRRNDELYLRVGDEVFVITDEVSSSLQTKGNQNRFELLCGSKILLSLDYETPRLVVPLKIDPTPFVEYEDFDFFYFIHNVLRNGARRDEIFR